MPNRSHILREGFPLHDKTDIDQWPDPRFKTYIDEDRMANGWRMKPKQLMNRGFHLESYGFFGTLDNSYATFWYSFDFRMIDLCLTRWVRSGVFQLSEDEEKSPPWNRNSKGLNFTTFIAIVTIQCQVYHDRSTGWVDTKNPNWSRMISRAGNLRSPAFVILVVS